MLHFNFLHNRGLLALIEFCFLDLGDSKEDWWNYSSNKAEDEENKTLIKNNLFKEAEEEKEKTGDNIMSDYPESPELKRSFKKLKKRKFSNRSKSKTVAGIPSTSTEVNLNVQRCEGIMPK